MKSFLHVTLLSVFLMISGKAEVTVFANYRLGEAGSLGIDNLPLDSSTNSIDFTNAIGSAGIGTTDIEAPFSTAYLDTANVANEGWYGGNLATLPTDDMAFGVYVRAANVDVASQGDVFTIGGGAGAYKLSLASNGWGASANGIAWIGGVGGVTGSFTADTWVHLALIRSGGSTQFYIDGVAQGVAYTVAPVNSSAHISVSPGGAAFFDGHIDEARVVTFSPGETVANILNALYGSDPDLDDDGLLDEFEQWIIDAKEDDLIIDRDDVHPEDDFDLDGYTNLEEQTSGSDPTDPLSPGSNELVLLAHWDFDDASDGTETLDKVSGRPGSVQGGAAFTADMGGRSGGAGDRGMDFGTDSNFQTVLVEDTAFINATTAEDRIAISFWQKNAAVAATSSFWFNTSGGERGIQSHIPWSDGSIYYDHVITAPNYHRLQKEVDTLFDWTVWHHFVFIKDGASKQLWIDGELFLSGSAAGFTTDITELWIGSQAQGVASLQGVIDDFAIFNRALTEDEISALASGASPRDLLVEEEPFVIETIDVNGDGRAVLSFKAKANFRYKVFGTMDFQFWEELYDNTYTADQVVIFTDLVNPPNTEMLFYRVQRISGF